MAMLRCKKCGRTLDSSHMNKIGLRCGLNGCDGIFEFSGGYIVHGKNAPKLDLRCSNCYHICSSQVTGLGLYSRCPMKGCTGIMMHYYGT